MVNVMKRVMSYLEINPERLLLEWVSAAEGARFAQVVTDFTQKVRELGPLSSEGESDAQGLRFKLKAARNALGGEKLRWVAAKQTEFKIDGNKYGEVFTSHEIGRYLDGVILEEIIFQQILLILQHETLSVKEISSKLQLNPSDTFKYVMSLLRKEMVEVSDTRGRSPLYCLSNTEA